MRNTQDNRKKLERKGIKKFRIIFLITMLLIILIYVANITSLPDEIIVFKNENVKINTVFGLEMKGTKEIDVLNGNAIQVSAEIPEPDRIGTYNLQLNLFKVIPIKNISVSVIPTATVIPLGNVVGLKMYTNGVLVVGMSDVEGKKPYEKANIEEGDMIIEVNDEVITCTVDLLKKVEDADGKEVEIKYVRDGNILETMVQPVKTKDNEYKLGLWVRDAAAGVGTVSFYEPATGKFAALGHGILDIDTDKLLDIASGKFVTTDILNVIKGTKGNPGRIQGTIEGQHELGSIEKNTEYGVFGVLENSEKLGVDLTKTVEVALRSEIKTGKATILCALENEKVEEYEIEIQKIFFKNNENNKSMIIKVTDKRLLEKTGGIIQGMSGSPIMQEGKLIGAVTHVLVSDPTQGYAIFGDLMIKEMREVK